VSYIPRSLAFDMLFGSNKGDGHAVIDTIYDGIDDYYEKEIEALKKDRDYWKKSFNKQVEASRK